MHEYEVGVSLGERYKLTTIKSKCALNNDEVVDAVLAKADVSYRYMLIVCSIAKIA